MRCVLYSIARHVEIRRPGRSATAVEILSQQLEDAGRDATADP